MRDKSRGFSLFEIILVMGISVTIAVIGAINLAHLQTVFRLRSVAEELKSAIQYGRELAISNKNQEIYSISMSASAMSLLANGKEFNRFQIPVKITVNPPVFSWNYTAFTGEIASCAPCNITLSSQGEVELITVQANGIVN